MYMTYETRQFSDYKKRKRYIPINTYNQNEGIHGYPHPPRIFATLPKPNYTPSKLVRTSDMKVIPGEAVNEGYCALSYVWNQSGNFSLNKNTKTVERMDLGKHKIIFPAYTVRRKPRGRKRIPRKVKYVKYEGLIQQICKDFNIKYIWYDQMCINNDDNEEKQSMIHEMHRIYSNAYCTLALIPEFIALAENIIVHRRSTHNNNNGSQTSSNSALDERISQYRRHFASDKLISESQWMKRMWTMQETLSSNRLLIVGRNIHKWQQCPAKEIIDNTYSITMDNKLNQLTVGGVLYHAHLRLSSNDHDWVFAVANLFPEIISKMIIDYNQPIMELMIQFYGSLAKKDLTILCFGAQTPDSNKTLCRSLNNTTDATKKNQEESAEIPIIQKYKLPSWTGVQGEHLQYKMKTSFQNYSIDRIKMHITCTSIKNSQLMNTTHNQISLLTPNDIPPRPQENRDSNGRRINWILTISIQLPDHNEYKIVRVIGATPNNITHEELVPHVIQRLLVLSQFMTIKKGNLHWWHKRLVPNRNSCASLRFDYLTEEIHETSQYAILSGVPFEIVNRANNTFKYYPVIKKEQGHYKSIGVCRIDNPEYLFSDYNSQAQTFVIQ